MKNAIALVAAAVMTVAGLSAEPWPRFRGPNGSGIAEDQKPPVEISPDKNVKWKVPVPSGLSSPIIAGDNVILTAFDNDKLYTIAYNCADGKEAWRAEAPAKQIEKYYKAEGSPAASTSATDGQRIVSYFGSFGLLAYDLSGKELWRYELPIPTLAGNFGSGVSPVIADGLVILVRDELKGSKILAVDLDSGKLRWEKSRLSITSYATPVICDSPEGRIVVAAGHGRLVGYDLKTGAEKWYVTGMPSGVCASPIAVENSLFFAGWSPGGDDDKENQLPPFDNMLKMLDTNKDGSLSKEEAGKAFEGFFENIDANADGTITRAEYESVLKFMADGVNSVFAVKSGGSGDISETHVKWRKMRGMPYIATAIAYKGQLVMVKDGGLVSAYDMKSGKVIFLQERVTAGGRYYASPVAANGNIYFVSLEDGAVTVLKGGTDKPQVVKKNPKLGERVAATPAIANNTFYLRTDKHLYAFSNEK